MWLQICNCSWLTASDAMLLRPTYTLTYVITDNRPMHTGSSTMCVTGVLFARVTIQTNNIDERVASCRCPCTNNVPRIIASYITTMFDVQSSFVKASYVTRTFGRRTQQPHRQIGFRQGPRCFTFCFGNIYDCVYGFK